MAPAMAVSPAPLDDSKLIDSLGVLDEAGWLSSKVKVFAAAAAAPAVEAASNSSPPGQAGGKAGSVNSTAAAVNGRRVVLPAVSPSDKVEHVAIAQIDDVAKEQTEVLLEFACNQIVQRIYQRGQRRIIAEVFCFPNTDCAYAAYNLLRRGSTTVVQRGDASSEDEDSISFLKGRYFIRIYGTSESDDESKGVVGKLADAIGSTIPGGGGVPLMIARIPSFGKVRGSEKLVMGPLSARRFFPIPYIGTVPFTNSQGGAVADYTMQDPPDRVKLLCINYSDPGSAANAYSGLVGALRESKMPVATKNVDSPTSLLFKVEGGYLLCRQAGSSLVVVSGAKHKNSPEYLARMF
jgi:hypothetical protein